MNLRIQFNYETFLMVANQTVEFKKRRADFDMLMGEAGEGELLIAICERYGLESKFIVVRDFVEFNEVLELFESWRNAVAGIEWVYGFEVTDEDSQ